ncbi:MAG: ABC transporter substrate-binding protein [Kineosporiaceae bacterium]
MIRDLLMPVDELTRRRLLGGGLALGAVAVAACGDDDPDASSSPEPSRDRQAFTDSLGRTVEIPRRPQRIVSLHQFTSGEALLSIGAPLVGLAPDEADGFAPAITAEYDLSDVESVGMFSEVDLEDVARLRPDLIVAYSSRGVLYPENLDIGELQRIAPTVALDEETRRDEFMDLVGTITGLQDEVTRQREQFEAELSELRAELGDSAADPTVAMVAYYEPDVLLLSDVHPIPYVTIPLDLGLRQPALAASEELYVTLSVERVTDIEADLVTYEPVGDPSALALWDRLPAVRAGQAHEVPTVPGNSYASCRTALEVLRPLLLSARGDVVP